MPQMAPSNWMLTLSFLATSLFFLTPLIHFFLSPLPHTRALTTSLPSLNWKW